MIAGRAAKGADDAADAGKGIARALDEVPSGFNSWGDYLERHLGVAKPPCMPDAHAHHILYKKGIGPEQQALVEEGQAILRKYGIDPFRDRANLVWAPNSKGQHTLPNLTEVLEALRRADGAGTKDAVVDALKRMGEKAAQHTP